MHKKMHNLAKFRVIFLAEDTFARKLATLSHFSRQSSIAGLAFLRKMRLGLSHPLSVGSRPVSMKKPHNIGRRGFLAEDMGLEPTGLLHLTRFPGELLSHSVNPPNIKIAEFCSA